MEPTDPLVSIITINYNNEKETLELLASLEQSFYKNFEVVVVDNASRMNPKSIIMNRYPKTIFRRSDINLGFAGGNNYGIEASHGEFIFMINNDTEITPPLIGNLVGLLSEDRSVGIISPKIIYHNTDIIQYAGYIPIDNWTARNSVIGHKQRDSADFQAIKETPYIHGAAMMTRKDVIETVGMLPEIFFLYYEELDWSEKVRQKGYRILVDQSSIIYHKESMSVGKMSPIKTYYQTRNRILFFKRNRKALNNVVFFIFLLFFIIPTKSISYIIRGEMEHVKAFLTGILWNLKPRS